MSGLQRARVEKRLTETAATVPPRKIPVTSLPFALAAASPVMAEFDPLNQGVVPTRGFGDAKPPTPPTVATPGVPAPTAHGGPITQRTVAERLLTLRSTLQIADSAGERQVKDVAELPPGSFEIVTITANYADPLTDADLQTFAAMPKLRNLRIQNSQITGAGIVHLKARPQLVQLSINRCPLTDANLQHVAGMTQLTSLDVSFTQVTDAGLVSLAGLKSLTALNLTKTSVTDAGVARLQQALPNCKIVR
jgi:hypothetical protein